MPVRLQQHTFNGGEVSPTLAHRSDIDKYFQSTEISRNGWPTVEGAWVNRPGSKFIGEYYDEARRSRLISFTFSDEQAYCLEIADRYFRVIRDGAFLAEAATLTITNVTVGGLVTVSTAHTLDRGDKVSIAGTSDPLLDGFDFFVDWSLAASVSSWTSIDLTAANLTVITKATHLLTTGDRIYITGCSAANRWLNDRVFTITTIDANSFTLDEVSVEEGLKYVEPETSSPAGQWEEVDPNDFQLMTAINPDTNRTSAGASAGTVTIFVGRRTPWLEADLRELTFEQSADAITFQHKSYPQHEIKRGVTDEDWDVTIHETTESSITPPKNLATSGGGAGLLRTYTVTAVDEDTGDESRPHDGITARTYGETLTWAAPDFGTALKYWVYAGDAATGQFGLVGLSNGLGFDLGEQPGITPEVTVSYPKNIDPFNAAGKYPRAGSYFQERIVFAGSVDEPQGINASASGAYRSFAKSIPIIASDAIKATIVGREVNPILHMLGTVSLVLFTASGVWIVEGNAQGAITAVGDFNPKIQTNYGISQVRPLQIGDVIVYVQSDGRAVRDLAYVFETDSHSAVDLTVLSTHLFEDDEVVEWDYAKAPDSLVWAVRDEGTMLTLTYVREHKVFAWSRQDTEGDYETVASVQEGNLDNVYVGVKRTIAGVERRYVERFTSRITNDVRDSFFLDCGLTLEDSPQAVTINKLDPVELDFGVAHGLIVGDLVDVEHLVDRGPDFVGTEKEDNDPNKVHAGDLHNKRFVVRSKTANTITLEDQDGTRIDGTVDSFTLREELPGHPIVRVPVTALTGALHLAGQEVTIVADGFLLPKQTVTATGGLTLTTPASRVHVGLGYTSDVRTLQPAPPVRTGTLQTAPTLLSDLKFRFDRSRGGWAGEDVGTLTEIKQRQAEGFNQPIELYTGERTHEIGSGWKRGQIMFRQVEPFPVTLMAIVYDAEFGR